MNKAELIEALAAHIGGNKAEAARMLNLVTETIMIETARHGKVGITGFGVFERIDREERVVRNPRTGERKTAPATAVARFRPGSELKAYLSGAKDLPAVAPEPAPARKSAATKRPAKKNAKR